MYPFFVTFKRAKELKKVWDDLKGKHDIRWFLNKGVEKVRFTWVYANDLLNSIFNAPNITNVTVPRLGKPGKRITLYMHLAGTLMTREGINFLLRIAN